MRIYVLITEPVEKKAHRVYDKIFECFPGNKTASNEYDTPDGYMVVIDQVTDTQMEFIKQIKGLKILTEVI